MSNTSTSPGKRRRTAVTPRTVADQSQHAVVHRRLSDAVADRIKTFIIERRLCAGDRLPTEQELADMFGVSRISVREATKALGFIGILDAAPRRGLTVGRIDMTRVTEYLGFHFALNDYPMDQLLKTRIALESAALAESVHRIASDDALYQRLMAIVDQHAAVAKTHDLTEYIHHDVMFHRTLLEAGGIEPLLVFNDLVNVFFDRFRELVLKFRKNWGKGVADHRRIVLALRAGDAAEATRLLRKHLTPYQRHL